MRTTNDPGPRLVVLVPHLSSDGGEIDQPSWVRRIKHTLTDLCGRAWAVHPNRRTYVPTLPVGRRATALVVAQAATGRLSRTDMRELGDWLRRFGRLTDQAEVVIVVEQWYFPITTFGVDVPATSTHGAWRAFGEVPADIARIFGSDTPMRLPESLRRPRSFAQLVRHFDDRQQSIRERREADATFRACSSSLASQPTVLQAFADAAQQLQTFKTSPTIARPAEYIAAADDHLARLDRAAQQLSGRRFFPADPGGVV